MSYNQVITDEKIKQIKEYIARCIEQISKRLIGQREMINGLLMGIISGGHVLLEGVPGLAKTLAVKTLSDIFDVKFKRIQFTPDLLPADIIGTMIYKPHTGEFLPRKGPIFANIILADEINRAPAKVQSALLEAMQEKQVTIGKETFKLSEPFFVLATQNPIEQEGTYPLPEAQLDRFVLKLNMNYPQYKEEVEIVKRVGIEKEISVQKVLDSNMFEEMRNVVDSIKVDERIIEYIVALVTLSREKKQAKMDFLRYIEYGASPRASIYIYRCAKINALFEGRSFVIPEDIKKVAYAVLRHRIILNYEAESEGLEQDDIISNILSFIKVP